MDWYKIEFDELPSDLQVRYNKDQLKWIKKLLPNGRDYAQYVVSFGDRGDKWQYLSDEWYYTVIYF